VVVRHADTHHQEIKMTRQTFDGYGLTELRRHARELNVPGRSKMAGPELLAAVRRTWEDRRILAEQAVLPAVRVGAILRFKTHTDCAIRVTSMIKKDSGTYRPGSRDPLYVEAIYVSMCSNCDAIARRTGKPMTEQWRLDYHNNRGQSAPYRFMLWSLEPASAEQAAAALERESRRDSSAPVGSAPEAVTLARHDQVQRRGEDTADRPVGVVRDTRHDDDGALWAYVSFAGLAPTWVRAANLVKYALPTTAPGECGYPAPHWRPNAGPCRYAAGHRHTVEGQRHTPVSPAAQSAREFHDAAAEAEAAGMEPGAHLKAGFRERLAAIRATEARGREVSLNGIKATAPADTRRLGEMSPDERAAAARRAVGRFQGELDRTAPAIGRVLSDSDTG
jgi:hypothetical protein